MRLIIGGYSQGKLNYVLQRCGEDGCSVWDGELPREAREAAAPGRIPVVNHLHSLVKKRLEQGGCPEEEIAAFVERHPDCVIISDEIGNGIVPMDAFEREYRERTGRILVELAGRAEEVVRVICGIGQKIK